MNERGDTMLERFDRFTSAISSIHRFIQKIERDEMAKYGLKGAAAQYLLALRRYPQGITAAGLCEVCDRDKAGISRIISEMEGKGLLTRTSSGDSQYRALLTLTEKGLQAADFVDRRATLAVALAGKDTSPEDRATLYTALERIVDNIKELSRKGIPEKE